MIHKHSLQYASKVKKIQEKCVDIYNDMIWKENVQ